MKESLAALAFALGVVGYSVAATLFFVELARRDGLPWAARLALRVLAAAAGFQVLHILLASVVLHTCPVGSLRFGLSLSGLAVVSAFAIVHARRGVLAMGALVAPVALTFFVASQFVGLGAPSTGGVSRGWLMVHVSANVLGLALFLLAAFAAGFYLAQEQRLKNKRLRGLGSRLPALDALDSVEHGLLLAGFPLLTLGIVSGAAFVEQLGRSGEAAIVRALLTYACWLLVAALLALRAAFGWRGRRAAWGTIAGAACVLAVVVLYAVRPALGAS